MVFLNPAVLFGLLAASIPIVIHLLNLRKLKKIEFSTLSFLKELQKNKIRKIKLKQWLLLLLRVLIILFLVTAFARPTLEGVAIGGTTSAAKTTAVFILDDTFSMSVLDQNGSNFNQAKQTIKNLLINFQEGDEVGLVSVSDPNTDEIRFTSDFSEFEKILESKSISFVSQPLHQVFYRAAEAIYSSDNFNKEIYILSDFQSGRMATDDLIPDMSRFFNETIRVYAINFSGKEIYNLSIDHFEIITAIFEKEKPISFAVTITNHSNQSVNNSVVSIFLNGERSSQKSISLNPGESKILELEAVAGGTGFIDAVVELEEDDIEYDNRRFLSIYIPDKIPVLLLYDIRKDLEFIEVALATGNVSDNYDLEFKPFNQILSSKLEDYYVIIVVGESVTSGLDRLNDFVKAGGGLVIFPSSQIRTESFNNLLSGLNLPKSDGIVGSPESSISPIFIGQTDFEHPLFKNIFQTTEKKTVESPEIYSYYRILSNTTGRALITLPDGSGFLTEQKTGAGKILLFNSAPVLSWNSFPFKGLFPALINKAVLYLSTKEKSGSNYVAGEPVNISLINSRSSQLKIMLPDGNFDYITITGENKGQYVLYENTKLVGNYEVFSEDRIIEDISVNIDPVESVTEFLSESEIRSYFEKIKFTGNLVMLDKSSDPASAILQARFGSELWKYFLGVAILLALIEMTLSRNTRKETEGINAQS